MDDAVLKQRAWRSLAAFQGLLAQDDDLLEHPDFVASRVPDTRSSLINAAVPRGPIAPHLDAIERFFDGIPNWGVWLDPTQDPSPLTTRGLVLDSTPVLMAAPLTQVSHSAELRVKRVSLDEVGVVNDAAYGIPAGTLGDVLVCISSRDVHPYGIKELKEAVSVGVVQDVDDDAFVIFVATLPDYRGERLASTLLAHALHEAHERGQTTTSLQASKLGQSIYLRIGYRPLGEIHLYERRP